MLRFRTSKPLMKWALLLAMLSPQRAHATTVPMISLGWDRMLGLNIGLGIDNADGDFICAWGPLVYGSVSLMKPAAALTVGHFATCSMRNGMYNGVQLMAIGEDPYQGLYLGLEHSMSFGIFEPTHDSLLAAYYRVGGGLRLREPDERSRYFNGAVGLLNSWFL